MDLHAVGSDWIVFVALLITAYNGVGLDLYDYIHNWLNCQLHIDHLTCVRIILDAWFRMEKGRGREEFLFNPKDWFTTVYLCSQIHQRLVLLACYTLIFLLKYQVCVWLVNIRWSCKATGKLYIEGYLARALCNELLKLIERFFLYLSSINLKIYSE